MQDHEKTKEQLIDELAEMRSQLARLEVTEKPLNHPESRYCEIISSLTEAAYIIQDGSIKFANQACLELSGYSIEEGLTANAIEAFVHPDDQETVVQYYTRRLQGDITPHRYEFKVICKDGSLKWVELKSTLIMWEGRPAGLGVATDVSDRKRTEETLVRSEQMLRTILSISPVGIGIAEDRVMKWVNEAWVRMFGFANEQDCIGLSTQIIYPSEDEYSRVGAILYPKLETGVTTEVDASFHRKDGSIFDGHIRMRAINPSDHSQGTIAAVLDITDRRRMQEDLRVSEEKFSKAFYLSPDAIIISRLFDGMIVSVNEGFKQLSGYEEDEFVGKTVPEINIWDNLEDRDRWIEQLKTKGIVANFEARFRSKKGDIRYGLMSASTFVINGVEHILNVARDITDRKLAEEEREKSEMFLNQIVENIPDMVFVKDANNLSFVRFNRAGEELLGYSREDLIGKNDYDFFPQDQADLFTAKDREVMAGGKLVEILEEEINTKLKGKRILKTKKIPILDAKGTPKFLLGISEDITDHKRSGQERQNLRAQLLQSQKMETMGTLATGIAHDFNNMLQVILGFSGILLADKNEGDPGYEGLQKIVKTAQDAADLVQRIRISGRRAEMNLVPLDLNHQVDEVTKLLSSTLPLSLIHI